jgi:hypothetical protein
MGERALAFCHRPDGTREVFYSQWAGAESVAARVIEAERFERQCEILAACDWRWQNRLAPDRPLFDIDYLTTAVVYIVSNRRIIPFVAHWFGLPLTGGPTEPDLGALVCLDTNERVRERRWQFQQLKTLLQDTIDSGYITPEEAIRIILLSLEDRQCYLSPACRHLAEGL